MSAFIQEANEDVSSISQTVHVLARPGRRQRNKTATERRHPSHCWNWCCYFRCWRVRNRRRRSTSSVASPEANQSIDPSLPCQERWVMAAATAGIHIAGRWTSPQGGWIEPGSIASSSPSGRSDRKSVPPGSNGCPCGRGDSVPPAAGRGQRIQSGREESRRQSVGPGVGQLRGNG